MAELRCERLSKSYRGREVLHDLDLLVPSGTLTSIIGASGSGKTTLLRVVMGFSEADAGRVLLGGETLADAGLVHLVPDKRAIGYVAQEGALFPHLTAGENVGFGLPRAQRRHGGRIVEALELVGLDASYAPRPSHELSGGEQRRVALARALAPKPRVVLLDEPFSGLDAALRAETREAVLEALQGEGTTALLVTHDQAEALSMGREVAVLRDGRLVQVGAPRELYRTPADPDIARFIGEAVIASGRLLGGYVESPLGRLAVSDPPHDGPVQVMVRPEQIRMTTLSGTATGAVRAHVIDHAYFGPDTVTRLTLEGSPQILVKARSFDQEVPAIGETVELSVVGPVVAFPAPLAPVREESRAIGLSVVEEPA
jgi:iron(III) transport system ATP-binding protein